MEVLTLLQSQLDSILVICGVCLFFVFIVSARLYVLVLVLGLWGFGGTSQAFTLKISSFGSSNVFVSGFSTGRVYQVVSVDRLTGSPVVSNVSLFLCTNSTVFSIPKSAPYAVSVFSQPGGWVNTSVDFNSTNLVWVPSSLITNYTLAQFIRASDITMDCAALLTKARDSGLCLSGVLIFSLFKMRFL